MNWFKNIVFISHFFLSGDFVSDEVKPDEVKPVIEGDSVTLYTDITDIQRDDLILWMFGPQETRIAQIYMKDIMFTMKEIFGDRLKLDSETGSLTITNISITHTGLYKLQIFRKTETKYKRFSVIVYAPLSDPVIARKSSSGRSSSSKCVLLCSVLYGRDLSLSWYKRNSLLSSISEPDTNNKLSLTLEVDFQDTNTYSCVVNNPIRHQTLDLNNVDQKCSGLSLELKHPLVHVIVLLVSFSELG
ncbi:hepatic and glial cell adhesion molecule-like [Misgurnus anguillicaudatus]|uniref:hepatic and glial cell adhesion molecule-like n=1 Tax=Misgurnus anguillicaudatus TaxID=75329 RepID=UPI003CCFCF5C